MTSSFRVHAWLFAVLLATGAHSACKSGPASDTGAGGEGGEGGVQETGGGGGGSDEGGQPGGEGGSGATGGATPSGGAGGGGSSGGAGAGGAGGAPLGTGGSSSAPRTLLPPAGKTLLIVGQDVQTVLDYAKDVSPNPAGITTYTSISETNQSGPRLEGLTSTANQGGGDINAAQMAARFANSVLSIGLYLVDHTGTNLDHIADGTHDAAIDQLGAFIKSVQRPVFLRIGYEFDGTWNHYESDKYKAAFRRIALRLRPAHPNVAFVWQSATYAEGRYRNLPLASWYPGDDVVDWFGSSYFKYAAAPHTAMLEMARQHSKPLLIAEASPQGYDLARLRFSDTGASFTNRTAEQVWQGWFEPFFRFIETNQDVIRAVAYINAHWDAQPMWSPQAGNGYWGDARVQANPLILERWRSETAKPRWLHASATLFDSLTAARP